MRRSRSCGGRRPPASRTRWCCWMRTCPTWTASCSSAGRPDDIAKCRELGINAYLLKPIKQSDLLATLLTALDGSRRIAAPRDPSAAAGVRPLRVLLAEDNAVNQKLATRLLEKQGHQVVVVTTG